MRDRDVRAAVLDRLAIQHADDPTAQIIQEMGVWSGTVRVDIAVVNGELCGYELKSDSDTLERLPLQADIYSRVFDRVTLVVGERHAKKARAIIPKWWGVTIARMKAGAVELVDDRKGRVNPKRDASLVAELLSRDETILLLEKYDLATGWRSKRVSALQQRLVESLTLAELLADVREAIKRRRSGEVGPGCLDVSVHRVAYPDGEIAWSDSATGDLVDFGISPAVSEWVSATIAHNGAGMADELDVHVHRPQSLRPHTSANQKLILQGIFRIDGEAPRNS